MKMKKNEIEIILNKSLTYFMGIAHKQIGFKFLYLLKNCYMFNGDDDAEFFVLYKWSGNQNYIKWEEEIFKHHLFVGHEDYDNYVLYKFRLSPNMRQAKQIFLNGKYSMLSDEDKNAIDEFLKIRGASNRNKIQKILNRDAGLRKEMEKNLGVKIDKNDELSSKPNSYNEDFSNFRKEVKFEIEQFLNEDEDDRERS